MFFLQLWWCRDPQWGQNGPKSGKIIILAHPSYTFPEKWGFQSEGVRHGTFSDAHPPRKNLIFQEKCRKGVQKSSPESTFSRKYLLKPTRELNPRKSRFCCFSPHRGETLVRLVFYDVSKRWFFMILCNRQKSAKRRNSKKWQNFPCFYSKNHRFSSLGFRVSVGSVQSAEKCKTSIFQKIPESPLFLLEIIDFRRSAFVSVSDRPGSQKARQCIEASRIKSITQIWVLYNSKSYYIVLYYIILYYIILYYITWYRIILD